MILPQFISFQNFFSTSDLLCVFSTRQGGVSSGKYHSLNLGLKTGDSRQSVMANREKLLSSINIIESKIAFTDQVHSTEVKFVTEPGIYEKTDALITNQLNLYLAIQAADCFPVFIYYPGQQLIAAIHAGWRGALNGIIEKTITHMCDQFKVEPGNLLTAIGPGLQKECFEVQKDVFSLFEGKYLTETQDKTKQLLDLQSFIVDQLKYSGVIDVNIFNSDICTKCQQTDFYSYRRDQQKSGRMMGIIGVISKG